jgi:hypothetical protein
VPQPSQPEQPSTRRERVATPIRWLLLGSLVGGFAGALSALFLWLLDRATETRATSEGLVYALPIAPLAEGQSWTGVTARSFDNVFSGSQRMLFASLIAFLVSQLVDIGVFDYLKRLSGARLLWLRATGSTAASQLIDTVVINFAAWVGVLGTSAIVNIVLSAYVLKLLIAIGLTPLVYLGHGLVARGLGLAPAPLGAPRSVEVELERPQGHPGDERVSRSTKGDAGAAVSSSQLPR